MHIFDIETNGFVEEMDRVHLLVIRSGGTPAPLVYRHNDEMNTIAEGVRLLMDATLRGEFIVGHNIIKFDIPALQKIFPWFQPDMRFVLDTLVLARAIYPDVKQLDASLVRQGRLSKSYYKQYSLEAWGHRLSVMKGEYEGDVRIEDPEQRKAEKWQCWNPTMEEYGVQDVVVTEKLLDTLQTSKTGKLWWSPVEVEAIRLEHDVQYIIARQERRGFRFDQDAAVKLYEVLTKRQLELEAELKKKLPMFYQGKEPVTPTKDRKGTPAYTKDAPFKGNKQIAFCAGAAFTPIKSVEFNPGSRDHVAYFLKRRYGWEPVDYTDDGKPKIDETVLAQLSYPEAKLLADYYTVLKRLGQLATGKEAWLKHVTKSGRIHGSVNTNGAVTGRMTHSKPNMGQVPASRSPYGHECRVLFLAGIGYVLVGADADALELRCLAHFMARYDDGAYIKVVLEGKKELGTDIHSVNARALGMDPKAKVLDGWTGRDLAKTWFYAFIYGAGDEKLGTILTGKKGGKSRQLGKKSRADFMANLPALGKLVEAVKKAAAKRGHLVGLDGRLIKSRSEHSALNTLLQSAGAVVMKRALVILDRDLQGSSLRPGSDYEFVANVHDEWQIEATPTHGERIGKAAAEAIRKAGEHYRFRCPLAGAYGIGQSWAETH